MSKGQSGFRGHVITVAIFAAIFLAWLGFILSESGTLPTPGEKYEFKSVVPSASLLTPGARVTVAGVEVGSVKSVERADDVGPNAVLTMEITDDRVTPIPRDSTVAVRTRSQVGENYVSVTIGEDPEMLPEGETLAIEQAEPLVNVDEILSILRGETRERTRALFAEFGAALTGNGDELNATLSGLNGFAEYGGQLVGVLHRDREIVGQLVDQLGRVMSAVGDRGAAIDTIATSGLTSLQAIAARDAALAETLRELPATLEQVRTTTATVGSVSDRAAPVVSNLALATEELQPALRDLVPTASAGRELVGALDEANDALAFVLREGAPLGPKAVSTLPHIETTFCELNPTLRFLTPYTEDVLQIAYHLGSGANAYDATGHLVRLTPIINDNSLSGAPGPVLDAAHTLFQSGLFTRQKVINYDPYMTPGEIGTTAATSGSPSGPAELKESGYEYPRVEADC